MNLARGLITLTDGEGRKTERETFTCCHCNSVRIAPLPGSPEVGFCPRCFARECIACAKTLNGRCTPFERRLEQYEARQRLFAALG